MMARRGMLCFAKLSLYRRVGSRRASSRGEAAYAPSSHFLIELLFAAPDNGLPFLSTAAASQHLFMLEVLAAPESALPFLSTALLTQVSCAHAEPMANADIRATIISRFISLPPLNCIKCPM